MCEKYLTLPAHGFEFGIPRGGKTAVRKGIPAAGKERNMENDRYIARMEM